MYSLSALADVVDYKDCPITYYRQVFQAAERIYDYLIRNQNDLVAA